MAQTKMEKIAAKLWDYANLDGIELGELCVQLPCAYENTSYVITDDRRGCANIMCDRYSHTYGYICNDCFEELVALGMGADIRCFMELEVGEIQTDSDLAREHFDREFKDLRDTE